MTTINVSSQFTMLELANRTNNKDVIEIANVLAQANDIVSDAYWVEANQKNGHVGTKATLLPSGTWRQANQGAGISAASTRQVTEPIGRLEDFSDIDEAILDLNAEKKGAIRSGEDKLHLEGLAQEMAETIIYGDRATTPEQPDGLATRYDALSMANVFSAGGKGSDTTSLWLIKWGEMAFHLVYPKGTPVGLHFEDKGRVRVTPEAGKVYYAYETQFVVNMGLFVHDDRCVQRIANIETSGSENTLDDDQIVQAINNLPRLGGGAGSVIYVNKTLKTQLDILAKDRINVNYTTDNAFGEPVTRFRGIPVRMVEQIKDTETAIS